MFARSFKKVRSVNSNTANFPTFPTVAAAADLHKSTFDPETAAGRVVIPLVDILKGGGGFVPRYVDIFPFGLGANDDTFSLRLIGWRRYLPMMSGHRTMFVPSIVTELACTMSTYV